MKKFIYLAIALIALPFALTSCSDDDDLPNVDYTIEIAGGVMDQTDNQIYVVQGDTLTIESLGGSWEAASRGRSIRSSRPSSGSLSI